jgi:hypothetical protein
MELRGRMEATKRLWVVEAMGRERGNGDGAEDFWIGGGRERVWHRGEKIRRGFSAGAPCRGERGGVRARYRSKENLVKPTVEICSKGMQHNLVWIFWRYSIFYDF